MSFYVYVLHTRSDRNRMDNIERVYRFFLLILYYIQSKRKVEYGSYILYYSTLHTYMNKCYRCEFGWSNIVGVQQ